MQNPHEVFISQANLCLAAEPLKEAARSIWWEKLEQRYEAFPSSSSSHVLFMANCYILQQDDPEGLIKNLC